MPAEPSHEVFSPQTEGTHRAEQFAIAVRSISGDPVKRNLLFEATKTTVDKKDLDPDKPYEKQTAVALSALRNSTPIDGDIENHLNAAALRIRNNIGTVIRVGDSWKPRYDQAARDLVNQVKGLNMMIGAAVNQQARANIIRRIVTIAENKDGDSPVLLARAKGTFDKLILAASLQKLTPQEGRLILAWREVYSRSIGGI